MSCAQKLIGVKACNLDQPLTGLYLDSIGLPKSYLDKLNGDQYKDGTELFTDKLNMAFLKLQNDILNKWSPVLTGQTINENARIGQVITDYTNAQAPGANYQGVRMRFSPNNTSFIKLSITHLEILGATTDKTVVIYDLIEGVSLQSVSVPVGGEHVAINIPAQSKAMDIAVVWQMDEPVPKTTVNGRNTCVDCGGGWNWLMCSRGVQAVPVEVELDGSMNLVATRSAQFTAGVSMLYTTSCDYASFLCSLNGHIALPLLYATGIEVLDYGLTVAPAYRSNAAVDFNIEGMEKLRSILADKYNAELGAFLNGYRIPDDPLCFKCTQPLKYVTALP